MSCRRPRALRSDRVRQLGRIRCPEGHARLSLASYYYSTEKRPGRVREPLIRRPRRPGDPWRYGIAESRHVAMGLVQPLYERFPAIERGVNRLRRDLGPDG